MAVSSVARSGPLSKMSVCRIYVHQCMYDMYVCILFFPPAYEIIEIYSCRDMQTARRDLWGVQAGSRLVYIYIYLYLFMYLSIYLFIYLYIYVILFPIPIYTYLFPISCGNPVFAHINTHCWCELNITGIFFISSSNSVSSMTVMPFFCTSGP